MVDRTIARLIHPRTYDGNGHTGEQSACALRPTALAGFAIRHDSVQTYVRVMESARAIDFELGTSYLHLFNIEHVVSNIDSQLSCD
jgi:hypothetical protein